MRFLETENIFIVEINSKHAVGSFQCVELVGSHICRKFVFDGRRSEEIHGRWDGSRDSSPDGSRWICYENRLINKKIQNLGRF